MNRYDPPPPSKVFSVLAMNSMHLQRQGGGDRVWKNLKIMIRYKGPVNSRIDKHDNIPDNEDCCSHGVLLNDYRSQIFTGRTASQIMRIVVVMECFLMILVTNIYSL